MHYAGADPENKFEEPSSGWGRSRRLGMEDPRRSMGRAPVTARGAPPKL